MSNCEFTKEPRDVLNYQFNWATWLDTDTITTSTMSAETGITIDSDSNDTTTATVFLSGGFDGRIYTITNEIVTAAGLTKYACIDIKVEKC